MFMRTMENAQRLASRTVLPSMSVKHIQHVGRRSTKSDLGGGTARSNATSGADETMSLLGTSTVTPDVSVPWYIVRPDTRAKVSWDLFVGLLILYSVITAPLRVSFGVLDQWGWTVSDGLVDALFGVDIVLNFMTAFVDKETRTLVVDWRLIWVRYLRSWFAVDFVSTIPLSSIGGLHVVRVIRLARLLKLLRLLRLSALAKKADVMVDVLGISPVLARVVSILVKIVLMAHLTCCLWWGVAASEYSTSYACFVGQPLTTAANETLYDAAPNAQYLVSLYWTMTTLFGIGYGDYVPFTTNERVLCIFIILSGSASVGFIIGNISSVVDKNSRRSQRMAKVKQFMRDREFPRALRGRVRRYFHYYLSKKSLFDEQVRGGRHAGGSGAPEGGFPWQAAMSSLCPGKALAFCTLLRGYEQWWDGVSVICVYVVVGVGGSAGVGHDGVVA